MPIAPLKINKLQQLSRVYILTILIASYPTRVLVHTQFNQSPYTCYKIYVNIQNGPKKYLAALLSHDDAKYFITKLIC